MSVLDYDGLDYHTGKFKEWVKKNDNKLLSLMTNNTSYVDNFSGNENADNAPMGIRKGLRIQGCPELFGEWVMYATYYYDAEHQYGWQSAYDMISSRIAYRYKRNGSWFDWAYINDSKDIDFNGTKYSIAFKSGEEVSKTIVDDVRVKNDPYFALDTTNINNIALNIEFLTGETSQKEISVYKSFSKDGTICDTFVYKFNPSSTHKNEDLNIDVSNDSGYVYFKLSNTGGTGWSPKITTIKLNNISTGLSTTKKIDVRKFLPIFGTIYGRGVIADALNVDLTSAEGDNNRVGYVYKGGTVGIPDSVEWGIREVFYYNESNVIVKITGWDNQVSQITSWYNIYSSGSWVGWTKQLTDKGGQMNGELKLSYGSSVANGAYVPSSTTISDLCSELSKSSGCSGSVSLVQCTWNNVTIPAGWYNYLYIPHRTGGKNGAENGDNHQYGTLLLFGMTTVSQCFRVAWVNNKIASIEMILSASDGFSDTLLASRTGRLYVYSNTKGDVVTTNGRSAINNTGAKSIIIKGSLGLPIHDPSNIYGGHMIISVEGKGSWLDNDANDNWGLAEDPLTYITPCGNTVYIYHMAGSWAYDGYPTSFVTLANGEQYSITDSCGFFGDGYSENYRYFKLMLSIADTVLFNSSYNSLQNVNIRQLSEGVKSLYPSKTNNPNVSFGNGNLYYFIANSSTPYRPEDGCVLHAAWNNTNGYDKQLMLGDTCLWYRNQDGGTWGDWIRVADSKYGLNYNGNHNLISHNTSTQTMYSSNTINETGLIGTNIGNTTYNTRINSNWYMYLYSTGKISANQNISTASDEKVKEFSNNLETDYDSLIKIFDIIQPKSYKYKYSLLNSESIGFCAQEVENAFKSENIDPSKYSVLNIQYNYMMSRGDTEEDYKYYTKFMEISYNDLYNLAILKIKDMEEKHMNKLENLEARLSALENKEA